MKWKRAPSKLAALKSVLKHLLLRDKLKRTQSAFRQWQLLLKKGGSVVTEVLFSSSESFQQCLESDFYLVKLMGQAIKTVYGVEACDFVLVSDDKTQISLCSERGDDLETLKLGDARSLTRQSLDKVV